MRLQGRKLLNSILEFAEMEQVRIKNLKVRSENSKR